MSEPKRMTPERLTEARRGLGLRYHQNPCWAKDALTELLAHIDALTADLASAERERDELYNQMDTIVDYLGIAESDVTPIEAIQRIEDCRDAAEAKLREARAALARLVSEYDDDGEHGIHAYEQECPLCCAIEDARALKKE